jgi:hypothetical protein
MREMTTVSYNIHARTINLTDLDFKSYTGDIYISAEIKNNGLPFFIGH